MPVRTTIPYNSGLYFITFACYKWLPLIAQTNGYDLVYKWFDYLRLQNHAVVGYVIMPNHLHVLIDFSESSKKLNTIIGDGKRFLNRQAFIHLIARRPCRTQGRERRRRAEKNGPIW